MPDPDPASPRFVTLVARHEERLQREWMAMNDGAWARLMEGERMLGLARLGTP